MERLLAIALVMIVSPASAETIYYRNSQGDVIGSAQSAGSSAFYYDKDGNNVGTSLRSGNTMYFYGNNGEVFSAQSVGGNQNE